MLGQPNGFEMPCGVNSSPMPIRKMPSAEEEAVSKPSPGVAGHEATVRRFAGFGRRAVLAIWRRRSGLGGFRG